MELDSDISVKLSNSEALVLFDMLARELDDRDGYKMKFVAERDGEIWALNGLLRTLEATLWQGFHEKFSQFVDDANAGLERKNGPWPD